MTTTFAVLAALALAAAPAGAGERIYVSNEGDGTVLALDARTGERVATYAVGKRPRGLKVDREGKRLYVAVSGSPRSPPGTVAVGVPDRAADAIAVVDLARGEVVARLPSGQDPEAFDLTPDGRTLVVSNEETAEASLVDLATGRVRAVVQVGVEPEGVTARPDGGVVAVTCEHDDRVDFVDPARAEVVARVGVCGRPRAVAFTRDGALAVVSCENDASIALLDGRALALLEVVKLPPSSRPMGVALSADDRRAFVSGGRGGQVVVVDLEARRVVGSVKGVGKRPWGIALSADGRRLFTANGPSGDVAVIDTGTLEVVARWPAGELPWGVVSAPGPSR